MTIEQLYSILYLEINLFAMALVLMIRIRTLGLSKMVAQRNFSVAIDTTMVFFASDTFWVLTEEHFLPYSKWSNLISKDIYFLMTALMCFAWFIYFEYLQDSPFVKNAKRMWGASVFVWLQFVLIIINHFVPLVYYVEGEKYYRGPLFILLYLFAYIYIVFSCARAFVGAFDKAKASEERSRLLKLSFFPVFPAIGGISQFLVPRIPVVCVMLALAILQLYLNWTTELISVDPLTRLNNRKQLLHNYEQWLRNNEDSTPIYCLMIDANRFKEINDTFGHIEGDAALLRIADALRTSVKCLKHRSTIARYGGDEFVVLAKAEKDEDILNLMEVIKTNLAELNVKSNALYELTVCMGMAKTDTIEDLPFKELADKADDKLYEEKKALAEKLGVSLR